MITHFLKPKKLPSLFEVRFTHKSEQAPGFRPTPGPSLSKGGGRYVLKINAMAQNLVKAYLYDNAFSQAQKAPLPV